MTMLDRPVGCCHALFVFVEGCSPGCRVVVVVVVVDGVCSGRMLR